MSKIKSLKIGDKVIRGDKKALDILYDRGFYWLIDSEFENADIEIVKDTIIWNSGEYYNGNWIYGIFKDGKFFGNFINGIFEGGEFSGKFISGIKKNL
jgi:hypothetical protein